MIVCAKCKKEMFCKKTGLILRWNGNHCYASDLFECSTCQNQIAVANDLSFSSTVVDASCLLEMDK